MGPVTPERFNQIARAFETLLERDPGERRAFLDALLSHDPSLQAELEALLAIDAVQGRTTRSSLDVTRFIGMRIGAYRISRLLGEGGMGVVFEAEQDQPCRLVALKLLKLGPASAVVRRFTQESQLLAQLRHPGIAHVYEAGTFETDFGPQPFFAMELIRGSPLHEYVEAHRLHKRETLELLARICDAVAHAHQSDVIHRDLKPANILIDETGQPKVLDFGVARVTATAESPGDQSAIGQLIGTVRYMSPEQALGNPLELDARSDIYSLGVILYELLAGSPPYRVSSENIPEAVRKIREEEPVRLGLVNHLYRGDVETIVATAMHKSKSRRYASAAEMAGDIRRYLADEPIVARPASVAYRAQKFASRHRALVASSAVICVVLIVGIVVSAREALNAREAEQTAQTVNDFLRNDLLAQASAENQSSPLTTPDPHLEVRTVLDRAAARIQGKFPRQQLVEASVRQTLGITYRDLGLYPEAERQLKRALDLFKRFSGEENPKTLAVANELVIDYENEGRHTEAEALEVMVLDLRRRLLGSDSLDTLTSMATLALIYREEGKISQAETLNVQVLQGRQRKLSVKHPDTLITMNNLAAVYDSEGKYSQAEALYAQVMALRRYVLGPEHPYTLITEANLAFLYNKEGKFQQAEAMDAQVLDVRRRVSPDHPDTLLAMNNLAAVYDAEGKYEQAEALLNKVLQETPRVLNRDHPRMWAAMNNLATVYRDEGKYLKAEGIFDGVLSARRRLLGERHPATLSTMTDLAMNYEGEGKFMLAEALLLRVGESQRVVLGKNHPDTLNSLRLLGGVRLREDKYNEAESTLRETLNTFEHLKSQPWREYNCRSLLGTSLAAQKKYPEAETLLISGYAGMKERESTMPANEKHYIADARIGLIRLYRDWGKPGKANEWNVTQ